jgi:hypothetical protein
MMLVSGWASDVVASKWGGALGYRPKNIFGQRLTGYVAGETGAGHLYWGLSYSAPRKLMVPL